MQAPRNWDPLHDAVRALDIKRTQELLEAGANPNAATEQGLTPCMLLCMPHIQGCTPGSLSSLGRLGCSRWLWKYSQEAASSELPALQQRLQLLHLLLGAGADLQAGFTPTGQPTCVPRSDCTKAGFAVVLAAAAGRMELLAALLPGAAAAPDAPGPTAAAAVVTADNVAPASGATPAAAGAAAGGAVVPPPNTSSGSSSSLCADSSSQSPATGSAGHVMSDDSPVFWAVVGRRAAAVQLLVERGYRLAPALEGPALSIAAQMKAQGAVEALLQSGVSPNTRYRSWTALHMACTPVSTDVDVRADKASLAHDTSSSGRQQQLAIIRKLVAAGADINARDEHGRTPLLVCAVGQQEAAALLLQELGADIHATATNGKGVLEAAWGSGTLALLLPFIRGGCVWQTGAEVEEWMPALAPYSRTMDGVLALLQHLLLLAVTLHKAVQGGDEAQAAACRRLLELLQPACSPDNAWWYEASIPYRPVRTKVLATTWQVVSDPQQLQQLLQVFGEMHVPSPETKRDAADQAQKKEQQQQRAEDPQGFLQMVCSRLPGYLLQPLVGSVGFWGVNQTVAFPNPPLLHALLMLGADASHGIIDKDGIGGWTPLAFCMPAWYVTCEGPTRVTTHPYKLAEMLPLVKLLVSYGASVKEPVPWKHPREVVELPPKSPSNTVWKVAMRYRDPQLLTALLEGASEASRGVAVDKLCAAASKWDAGTLRLVLGLQVPWSAEHRKRLLFKALQALEHPAALKVVVKWLVRLGGQEGLLLLGFAALSMVEEPQCGPQDTRLTAAAAVFLEADIHPIQVGPSTPLLLAVERGRSHYAKWLQDHGADASAITSDGKGMWALAAEAGVDRVASLLARGVALPEGGVEHLLQLLQAEGMKDTQLVHAERQLQQVLKANEKKLEKRQKRKEAPKDPAAPKALRRHDPAAAAEAAAAALLAAEEAEAAAKAAKAAKAAEAAKKAAKKKQQQQQQPPEQGSGVTSPSPDITDGAATEAAVPSAAAAAGGGVQPGSAAGVGAASSSSSSGGRSSVQHTAVQAPRDDVQTTTAAAAVADPGVGNVTANGSSSRSSSGGGGGADSSSSRGGPGSGGGSSSSRGGTGGGGGSGGSSSSSANNMQHMDVTHTSSNPPSGGALQQPHSGQNVPMGWASVVAPSSSSSSSSSSRRQEGEAGSARQPPASSTDRPSSSRQRSSSSSGGAAGGGRHMISTAGSGHGAGGQQHPVLSIGTAAAPAAAAGQAATPGPPYQGHVQPQPSPPSAAIAAGAAAAGPPAPQPSVGMQQLPPLGGLAQGSLGRATRIKECVVCLDARSCVLSLPCLHIVMCEACSQLLTGRGQLECPLDRSLTAARVVLPY